MAAQKKRKLIILAVVILIIAIVLSSFVYLNSQKPYIGNVESVTVGMLPHENEGLIYIAVDQQYFLSNGLNVTIRNYVSGLAAVDGLLKGEVDIATAADFVLVGKAIESESVCTFATVSKFSSEYIVVRTDRDISNASDLAGKKIGVSLGTVAEFMLGRFLELNNVQLSQVSLVDVLPAETPNALANGTVDAVIAWQPHIDTIKSIIRPEKIMIWPAQSDQPINYEAISKRNWVETHPETITKFLNSLAQAENYLVGNPDKSKAIVKTALNYSDEYITTVWSEYRFSLSLEQSLLLAMEDEGQWLINNNLSNATSLPNFLNYIYLDALLAVKPNAVTIIH